MDDITDSVAFKLHRVVALLDRRADAYLLAEHGIRYAAYLVLLMVRVLGPTSQHHIAANLAVSRASVSQRVAPLVAESLLQIERHPDDARTSVVSLTPQGRALVDAAWTGLDAADDLEAEVDVVALSAQLDRILENGDQIEGRHESR